MPRRRIPFLLPFELLHVGIPDQPEGFGRRVWSPCDRIKVFSWQSGHWAVVSGGRFHSLVGEVFSEHFLLCECDECSLAFLTRVQAWLVCRLLTGT